MHLHILGICGTFMGGLAALARESGHRVTGCDANVYPPMSDQLAALGIELIEGYGAEQLELAGRAPGFLIGGVPLDFGVSARLGTGDAPFVIEADEYDTAFFDKRSKFVHYRPRTAILNNLEFDHADIFDNLAAIERQFHHLVRTVPGSGRLVVNATEESLRR